MRCYLRFNILIMKSDTTPDVKYEIALCWEFFYCTNLIKWTMLIIYIHSNENTLITKIGERVTYGQAYHPAEKIIGLCSGT